MTGAPAKEPGAGLPPIRSVLPKDVLPAGARETWLAISGLAGYAGTRGAEQARRLDGLFGEGTGTWRIAWRVGDSVLGRVEALQLYEDAYIEFFRASPETLDWLCRTASEVYDNAVTNLASGLDYAVQEARSTHLQDVAIRRCLVRLGRRFEGDHLVEIRGAASEGFRLNPGKVPFHLPDAILPSEVRSWWDAGSIEAFWQHNKVVVVPPGAVRGRPSFAGPEGIWADLDGETSLLVPRDGTRFLRVVPSRTLRRRTNGPAGTRDLSRIVGGPGAFESFESLESLSRSLSCSGTSPRVEWKELVGEGTTV